MQECRIIYYVIRSILKSFLKDFKKGKNFLRIWSVLQHFQAYPVA